MLGTVGFKVVPNQLLRQTSRYIGEPSSTFLVNDNKTIKGHLGRNPLFVGCNPAKHHVAVGRELAAHYLREVALVEQNSFFFFNGRQ